MAAFRDHTIRSRSLALYAWLAFSVVSIRLLFRIVFNQPDFLAQTAIALPQMNIQLLGSNLHLFGSVSVTAITNGLVDGLRLAAIILAVGMANTVANPRKLLRSTPTALYEVATAAAVAINLAPQLVESLHRVRRARQLRSTAAGFRGFSSLVIPVLEGALESSLELAASMDARGFGLTRTLTTAQRRLSKFVVLAGVILAALSTFTLVAVVGYEGYALLGFTVSLILLVASFRYSAAHRVRTFYRIEKPQRQDFLALALVFAIGVSAWWLVARA